MNTQTSPGRLRSILMAISSALATLVILWLLLIRPMQTDLTDITRELTVSMAETEGLRAELAEAREELDQFKSGDSRTQATAKAREQSIKPLAAPAASQPEEPEKLVLQTPTVQPTAEGLLVKLPLQRTGDETPDLMAFVVRIPTDSEARITGFEPEQADRFSDTKGRIDASGKFAVFHGTPPELNTLNFLLEVTAPAKVTIRGTQGLKPFVLDIRPDAATPDYIE